MTITTDDLSTPPAVAAGPTRATQAAGFSSPALAVLPGLAVATAIAVGSDLVIRARWQMRCTRPPPRTAVGRGIPWRPGLRQFQSAAIDINRALIESLQRKR